MDAKQSSQPAVVRIATIRPADLGLPVTRSIDLSPLVAVERTSEATG